MFLQIWALPSTKLRRVAIWDIGEIQHWPFCKAQLKTSGLHCWHGSLKFALQMRRSKLRCKGEKKKWWLQQRGEHGDLILFFACPKLIQVPPAIDMCGCLRMARLINPGNSSAELPVSWSRHLSAPSSQPKSPAFLCIFWYFLQTSMCYFWSTCFIASDGNSFAAKESLPMLRWDEAAV